MSASNETLPVWVGLGVVVVFKAVAVGTDAMAASRRECDPNVVEANEPRTEAARRLE